MSADPVGSLAEEAAKLIAVMQDWARSATDEAADHANQSHAHEDDDEDRPQAHGAECRYCPLCQLARYVRSTSPEVRDHLASAALSMALAFKGLMENTQDGNDRKSPVEKIDLAED